MKILQAHASQKQKSCKATHNPTHFCSTFVFAPTHNDRPLQSKINLKPFLLLLTILIIGLTSYSQSYLGTISKQVNLREGPGTDYQVITSLKPKTQIFIVSLETEDELLINIIYGKGAIIGISPLSYGEIKEVSQISDNSGWNLRAKDGDAWFISDKEKNDYIVYKKKLEWLL